MKKLMFVAALAATAAAYASPCSDPTGPAPKSNDAAVYQWQFKGKTAVGVVIKGVADRTTSTTCADSTIPGYAPEVIRVPGSLAIQAYTYVCEDECNTFMENLTTAAYKSEYYATKPFKSMIYRKPTTGSNFLLAATDVDVAHIIGKNAKQYELAGTATFKFDDKNDPTETFVLRFAGFGSYNQKTGRISSVSGNFAGTQTPPCYPGKVQGITKSCPSADWWTCKLAYAGAPDDASVAYGTWSVKYNSAASAKFEANATKYWVK